MNPLQPIFDQLRSLLPSGSNNDKLLRLALYQELSKGSPLSVYHLAEKLSEPIAGIQHRLTAQNYLEFNNKQQIVGFRGMTLLPTIHKVVLAKSFFYTWCAFDTLFCVELIGQDAKISTTCPSCEDPIQILIAKRQNNFDKSHIKMSFVIPKKEHYEIGLKESFCCKVHFFCDHDCGEKWREGTASAQSDANNSILELFGLTDAFAIARDRNHYFLGKDKS